MREQLKKEAAKYGAGRTVLIDADTTNDMIDLIARQDAYIDGLEVGKNIAYSERNKLVAALSKVFPASLERHPKDDLAWEDDWRWIIMIDLPAGQASWHIHDSELSMFNHLHRERENYHSWDGHTTEEKYRRLEQLTKREE